MIRAGVAFARGDDGSVVGRRAARAARADCPTPKVALLFADSAYDGEALVAAVRAEAGEIPVWGTSSPRILSSAGPSEGGATLMLLDSDLLEFRLHAGRVKGSPRETARYLASQYLQARPVGRGDRIVCLLAGTEAHLRGIDYVRGLNDVFPFPPAVVGGASVGRFPFAGLDEFHGGTQYCGSFAGTDHLSLLFVRALDPARVRFGFSFEARYPPVAPPVVCTRAEGNRVFEVDGEPVFEYLRRFFGAGFRASMNQIMDRYTFATVIAAGGFERALVRAQNFDLERGSADFWPHEEMAGKRIQLVHTSRAEVIESAGRGAAEAVAALRGASPAFALAFDCVGRSKILLSKAVEEIDLLVDGLGAGVPLAGFYTAGEFAPLRSEYDAVVDPSAPLCGSSQFGCTLSLLVVAEIPAAAPASRDLRTELREAALRDEPRPTPESSSRESAALREKLDLAERTLTEIETTLSILNGEHSDALVAAREREAALTAARAENERLMELLARLTPRTVFAKASVSVRAGLFAIPDEEIHRAFLFMDIKGFTRFAETRPPDEVIAAINGLLGPATDAVYAEGGDVDKFIGDCIFATFPDGEGAVRAGLAMQRVALAAGLAGSPFAARVGIHFGRAVSGNVGGGARCDHTLIGDAVNLAQRLESACPPGRVLISAALHAKLSDSFKNRLAVRADRIAVKGKEAPVEVFEVDPGRSAA